MEQKDTFSKITESDTLLCVVVSVFLTHLRILNKLTFREGLLQTFQAGRGPVPCMCDCVWHFIFRDTAQPPRVSGDYPHRSFSVLLPLLF